MSGIIRYVAAPPHLPQTHRVIFLPLVNHSNPTQIEQIPISKFNIFNKHHHGNQAAESQYKTIQLLGNSPPGKYQSDSYTERPQYQNHPQPNRRFDYNVYHKGNGFGQSGFNNRDGWSHGVKGKESPAISALALLGFLFFLNLIQNSLLNNRLLLTSSAFNNTITGSNIAYGRNSRSGRVRQKRGLDYNEYILTSESIPTHPNRLLRNNLHPQYKTREQDARGLLGTRRERNFDSNQQKNQQIFNQTGNVVRNWIVQQIQRSALGCLQLVACNLGRTIFKDANPGGAMMRFLGPRLFPGSTKRSWTGRMVRAMSYGWGKIYTCDRLFRRCIFTNPFGLVPLVRT